jgi:zinc D-Ala-D-Ala dipeptidase
MGVRPAPPRGSRIRAARGRACFGTLLVALTALLAPRSWSQEMMPAGLVRLRDIAPGIHQDIRYATSFNFTGQVVPGYERAECMTRLGVARALARAQARLATEGLALKVYDCYRPLQSVRAFVVWSRSRGGDTMKPIFYPNLDKSRLFALGYISFYSRHSLGIAIDVGLVREGDSDATPSAGGRCDGPFEQRARESSLDLGTAYDCFSDLSSTASSGISADARANRGKLRRALLAEGFHNYAREWWHYEFNDSGATRAGYYPIR